VGEVLHRRRFDGGQRSPQEFHAEYAFPPDAKCQGCKAKPSVRAIVLCPLDEAEKAGMIPPGATANPRAFPELAPVLVPVRENSSLLTKPSWYVRVSMVYSCRMCRAAMERTLAKAPSWAIVEINEGPDVRNRVVVGDR
jgi:hypothetical protein